MSTTDVHRTLIVPKAQADLARTVAGAWHSGQGMFIAPLAAEKDPTIITHYTSTGMIGSDVAALLEDPAAFTAEINQRLGTNYSESEVQALRDSMNISSDGPRAAMERLGLVQYSEPERTRGA